MRHTSKQFAEDPLRIDRGMRFAGKFGFKLAPETAQLMKQMMPERQHLSQDRIWKEFVKFAETAKYPGEIVPFMHETGMDAMYFPELANLWGVPQEPEYHPEGDVNIHVMHVMNAMARICDRKHIEGFDRAIRILAAMLHDVAKPQTTLRQDVRGVSRITSHGHEEQGGPLVTDFLVRLGMPKEYEKKIRPVVERHLAHINYPEHNEKPDLSFIRNLAYDLSSKEKGYTATIDELLDMIEADGSGRPPLPQGVHPRAKKLYEHALQDNVHMGRPEPLVQGADILRYYPKQYQQGKHIGDIIKALYKAQLSGKFTTKEEALFALNQYMRKEATLPSQPDQKGLALLRGEHFLPYYSGKELGSVSNEAWDAQSRGEFEDLPGGLSWLEQRRQNKTPQ